MFFFETSAKGGRGRGTWHVSNTFLCVVCFIFSAKQKKTASALCARACEKSEPQRERTRTKTAACLSLRRLSTRPPSRPREEEVLLLQQQQEVEDLRIKSMPFTNTEIRNVALNGRRRVQTKNEEEETWLERRVNSRRR